jgi:hypothetical protein
LMMRLDERSAQKVTAQHSSSMSDKERRMLMLKLGVPRTFFSPPRYLVVAMVAQAFVSSPATAVLIAHWDLEEGAGATTTASIGAPTANGILLSGAGWDTQFLPPVVGGTSAAVILTGPPDGISTTFVPPTGGAARTIAAWIRADPTQLIPGVNLVLVADRFPHLW